VEIFNAISLYDKGTITISIEGSALSAASFIAMAADKVKMTDSSLFMIHDPHISIFGSLSELQSRIEMLIKGKDVVVEAYSKSSGQEKAEIQSMMTAETWMNAGEAKEKGFIDEIIELQSESKAVMQVSMDISDSLISKIPEQYRTLLRHTKERANMSELLGLAGDLQVTLQDGAKDEEIRAAIKQKFEEKSAETSAPVSKPKTSLPKSVLTMMADARETQLHALVTEGRITAAARDEFKKQYCDTVKMAASVQEDGEITDGFTGVLAALKKQEAVQTGEVTSMQRPHSLDPNDNPMMRAAQRRLEQYS
jgi:enoyl-CoA hydratase/carnithine racemase